MNTIVTNNKISNSVLYKKKQKQKTKTTKSTKNKTKTKTSTCTRPASTGKFKLLHTAYKKLATFFMRTLLSVQLIKFNVQCISQYQVNCKIVKSYLIGPEKRRQVN